MDKDDGGPFHPLTINRRAENGVVVECDVYTGASLRDHFAGLAMNGILSNQSFDDADKEEVAGMSYAIADAMLQARKEKAP